MILAPVALPNDQLLRQPVALHASSKFGDLELRILEFSFRELFTEIVYRQHTKSKIAVR